MITLARQALLVAISSLLITTCAALPLRADPLDQSFDPAGLGPNDIRLIEAALTQAGAYDRMFTGEWGPGLDAGFAAVMGCSSVGCRPDLRAVAGFLDRALDRFDTGQWDLVYDPGINLSFLAPLPFKVGAVSQNDHFTLLYDDGTVTIGAMQGTKRALERWFNQLREAALKDAPALELRQDDYLIWSGEARIDGLFGLRRSGHAPVHATLARREDNSWTLFAVAAATSADRAAMALVANSIQGGEQFSLLDPRGTENVSDWLKALHLETLGPARAALPAPTPGEESRWMLMRAEDEPRLVFGLPESSQMAGIAVGCLGYKDYTVQLVAADNRLDPQFRFPDGTVIRMGNPGFRSTTVSQIGPELRPESARAFIAAYRRAAERAEGSVRVTAEMPDGRREVLEIGGLEARLVALNGICERPKPINFETVAGAPLLAALRQRDLARMMQQIETLSKGDIRCMRIGQTGSVECATGSAFLAAMGDSTSVLVLFDMPAQTVHVNLTLAGGVGQGPTGRRYLQHVYRFFSGLGFHPEEIDACLGDLAFKALKYDHKPITQTLSGGFTRRCKGGYFGYQTYTVGLGMEPTRR
ncbi:hypothetical protein [Rhodobacter maris]|uniref:Uncharacterized protein n=1 Tax=Rhodobacter maris TaxID=446682 RepID=A0A285SEQ7_9RHOB|nr:hypothetical protein [Rhodobacter maris]SOC05762.1 hypothetical protein SAMN05877831_104208 [Rhodobacter maris]